MTAALCHAIPYSIGFSSLAEKTEPYELTIVELIDTRKTLSPLLPSVNAFIFNPSNLAGYPLVKKISLVIRNNYTDGGKFNSEVCRAAAELRKFLQWILTSNKAKETLSNAYSVLHNDPKEKEVFKSYLSGMKCSQNGRLKTTKLYEQEAGDHETVDLGSSTIFSVTGNCFGILLLVLGVMAMRKFLSRWSEIRSNTWRITELDIIPPESERLESFSNLMAQPSPRQSFHQFECSASCQRYSLMAPGLSTEDSKSMCGIYKSMSVALNPTQIPLSAVFDYATRKTLVELRKVSHRNVLRFYGLANLADRNDIHISSDDETRELRFTVSDDFSDRDCFSLENTGIINYYVVTEQCTGESIFYFMHSSTMTFPYEAKRAVIIQLIEAVEYLHNHGIVHGKLNSQCCYFDHNFNIKVGDWECLEILEKYRRLHGADIYVPSKLVSFLQDVNVLRPASDQKCRTMDCPNVNAVMRLRWRPPECLCLELPLVKELFVNLEGLTQLNDDGMEELEDEEQTTQEEIPLSHFQDITADIYSLGVIINEIWARAIPFSEKDLEYDGEIQLLEAVFRGSISLEIPPGIPEVVRCKFDLLFVV